MVRLTTQSSPAGCISVLMLLATLFLSGCLDEDTGLRFSHADHKKHQAECTACHRIIEDGEITRAGHEQCVSCHGPIGQQPAESCLKCHTSKDGASRAISRPDYSQAPPEHAGHLEEGVGCDECHGKVDTYERIGDSDFIRMEGCVSCHFPSKSMDDLDMECSFCHLKTRRDTEPGSHTDVAWKRLHGKNKQQEPFLCNRCHKQSVCDQCHVVEPPQDHTNLFKNRGHGILAVSNPQRCETCHQQNFCVHCHQTEEPIYHTRSFKDSSPYTHCGSCHFPLDEGNRCHACHQEAPHNRARAEAPPPPPFVNRSIPCFVCHPIDRAPVTHLYNTIPDTECVFCH